MISTTTLRKTAVTVAVLGSFGLSGAAIAGAADKGAPPQRQTLAAKVKAAALEATGVQADRGRGRRGGPGRHGETALTGETKQDVEAAVLAKYPGATIVRTETNRDSRAAYESHITTSDGKELEVLVSRDFQVVDAVERPARP